MIGGAINIWNNIIDKVIKFYVDTTGNLTLTGLITAKFPVHLSVYGSLSIFNSSGTLQGSTVVTGFWYLVWNNFDSRNWSDTYTNGCRLAIPYTGIYKIKSYIW